MDMTSMHINAPSTAVEKLVMLFLLFYPLFVWALSRMARRGGPMSASAIPAVLTPLFAGVGVSWAAVVNVIGAQSIMEGGGRSSSAAGVAEALTYVGFAAAVAALVSGASVVTDRRDAAELLSAPRRRRLLVAGAVGLVIFLVVLIAAELAVIRRIEPGPALPGMMNAAALCALAAGLATGASFAWLVASRRVVWLQYNGRRRLLASACTIAAMLLVFGLWRVINTYLAIAQFG